MEDEEGEQFNNTYLKDLITGGPGGGRGLTSATGGGRESGRFLNPNNIEDDEFFFGRSSSVPLSVLKMRNSMQPMHLRSSYAVQYSDQFSTEDDIKVSYEPKTPQRTATATMMMDRTFTMHRSSPDLSAAARSVVRRRLNK